LVHPVVAWGQILGPLPTVGALQSPCRGGCGAANLRSPSGGAANGMLEKL
jgi:hypothetical protein